MVYAKRILFCVSLLCRKMKFIMIFRLSFNWWLEKITPWESDSAPASCVHNIMYALNGIENEFANESKRKRKQLCYTSMCNCKMKRSWNVKNGNESGALIKESIRIKATFVWENPHPDCDCWYSIYKPLNYEWSRKFPSLWMS